MTVDLEFLLSGVFRPAGGAITLVRPPVVAAKQSLVNNTINSKLFVRRGKKKKPQTVNKQKNETAKVNLIAMRANQFTFLCQTMLTIELCHRCNSFNWKRIQWNSHNGMWMMHATETNRIYFKQYFPATNYSKDYQDASFWKWVLYTQTDNSTREHKFITRHVKNEKNETYKLNT